MSPKTPPYLEDLVHPDLEEDTSLMLEEIALALLDELLLVQDDQSCDFGDAFDRLAVATYNTAALARAATFSMPEESERVKAGTVRTLEMSATCAHPPVFAQFSLDDPTPKGYSAEGLAGVELPAGSVAENESDDTSLSDCSTPVACMPPCRANDSFAPQDIWRHDHSFVLESTHNDQQETHQVPAGRLNQVSDSASKE